MRKEFFQRYNGRYVKIKLKDNFGIKGTIVDVYDDCIEFKSHQGTSFIMFDDVVMLMEVN